MFLSQLAEKPFFEHREHLGCDIFLRIKLLCNKKEEAMPADFCLKLL